MRAVLSTIHQTLTLESSTILTHSIADARRRNHGQTTPLHVASVLLAAPHGLLRQACIKSHPNSSHPLQCRALELCFSVALDRLPSNPNNASSESSPEPPLSNALMAALKRAQAHQRRGCPEQQQSPLLAVKVELEQLVVSVLDDPSVSRVMKEASFSSPAVKAAIEQSISSSSSSTTTTSSSVVGGAAGIGFGLRSRAPPLAARNLYMNPRLQQSQQQQQNPKKLIEGEGDYSQKVMEILFRSKKRNPILVGDSDLSSIIKEVIERVERAELGSSVRVISLAEELGSVDKSQIPTKIRELEIVMKNNPNGVVLDFGDLKWLVESNGGLGARIQQNTISEAGKEAVAEMGKIIANASSRVWLLGTATCATYLRCQVYHPAMESEWDLAAVPIAPRAAQPDRPGPRLGSSNGILSSSVEALTPAKGFLAIKPATVPLHRPPETIMNNSNSQKQTLCTQCTENYERELAKLVEKSSTDYRQETKSNLPQWLQIAAPSSAKSSQDQFQSKEQELNWKQRMEELLKKWRQTCSHHQFNTFNLHLPQGFPPMIQSSKSSEKPSGPPCSLVKTDLVLGGLKPENTHIERIKNSITSFEDSDSLKRLFKGLMEKVSWQTEAASTVTAAVLQAKSGNGKRRGLMPKADTWLLFIGFDKIGKKKMAAALSELVFGVKPISVLLGKSRNGSDDGESTFRGRTALDRIAEAVKKNPFSVIVLEDVDQADAIVRGAIKRSIERGRLPDSYGREVTLGSVIFVLTANWLPEELKCSTESLASEEKILNSANSEWQLEISVGGKRLPDWLTKNNTPSKQKKESDGLGLGLSLDLNLAASSNAEDETGEGSWNSSDLTVEREQEHGRLAVKHSSSSASEFVDSVDSAIVFKPVDFASLRQRVSESISAKFTAVMGGGRSIRIDDNVLDRIVGGIWLSGVKIEEWAEGVLVPGIDQLRSNLKVDDGAIVRLSAMEDTGQLQKSPVAGDWLPSMVKLVGI